MSTLFLIPARGGSKGLPGKNIRPLNGKPLICYSIDLARKFTDDAHICVSSEDHEILKTVNDYGLTTPYIRPVALAADDTGTFAVIEDALEYYTSKGLEYDTMVLLQPTCPLRQERHLRDSLEAFGDEDVLLSVSIPEANPYYTLFEEDKDGFLKLSKDGHFTRRQDVPKVYQINGCIYILNTKSINKYDSINEFSKKRKYVMEEIYSTDIDDLTDFEYCEFLLREGKVKV